MIRQTIPAKELDLILDNIGLPLGGVNLAFSDSGTIGSMDGEILVSLKEGEHGPTPVYKKELRKRLHAKFPQLVFFYSACRYR